MKLKKNGIEDIKKERAKSMPKSSIRSIQAGRKRTRLSVVVELLT